MISASQLHYDFRRKFNRINSASGRYISVGEIDSYLTEALYIYFENRVAIAETNPLVRNDLRQYEVKKVPLKLSGKDSKCKFAKYPKDFYQLLRTNVRATGTDCKEVRDLITHIIKSDDISESLVSPFWKPSIDWEETFADEAQDGLYVYHNGAFDIKEVQIDYYRKPKNIQAPSLKDVGSYVDPDGNIITTDQGLDLDSTFAWRKIADIAVLVASRDVGDVTEYQSQLNKIMQVEKIHLQ